jgi:hypothetical protein
VQPTQGKTLAVMQVCGASQSFNAVNQLRILGRWMRMITIANESSVAMAYEQFDEVGRTKPSPYYDRIVAAVSSIAFNWVRRPCRCPAANGRRFPGGAFSCFACDVEGFGRMRKSLSLSSRLR